MGYRTLSSKYFNICYCTDPEARLAADRKVHSTNKNNPVHKAVMAAGLDLRYDILYESYDKTLITKARNYAHFICHANIVSNMVKMTNYNFVMTKKLIEKAIEKGTLTSYFKYDAPKVEIDASFEQAKQDMYEALHPTYDLQLRKFRESQFNFAHAKARIAALNYLSKHITDIDIDMDFFTDDMGVYILREDMEQVIKDAIGSYISSKLLDAKKSEEYHLKKLEFWSSESRVADFVKGGAK